MRERDYSVLRRAYPFKYLRPRLGGAILILILVAWPWFILHPSSFDEPWSYHGRGAWFDALLRSASPAGREAICSAVEVVLFYSLWSTYLPCLRHKQLKVLEDASVHGFGTWGQDAEIAWNEIACVTCRHGSAMVRGSSRKRLWIPLSLLAIGVEEKEAIEAALTSMTR